MLTDIAWQWNKLAGQPWLQRALLLKQLYRALGDVPVVGTSLLVTLLTPYRLPGWGMGLWRCGAEDVKQVATLQALEVIQYATAV